MRRERVAMVDWLVMLGFFPVMILVFVFHIASADSAPSFWHYQVDPFPDGFTNKAKLIFSINDHTCEGSIGVGVCPGSDIRTTWMGIVAPYTTGDTHTHSTSYAKVGLLAPCIDAEDCAASTDRRPTEENLIDPAWYLNLIDMEISPSICRSFVNSVGAQQSGWETRRCWVKSVNTSIDPEEEEGLKWTDRTYGPDGAFPWMATRSEIDVRICIGEVC